MATTSTTITEEEEKKNQTILEEKAKIAAQKLKEREAFLKRANELIPKHMEEIKKLEAELQEEGANFKKKDKLDNLRRATMGSEEELLELIKLLA
jgi:hypothetical protein